MRDPNPPEFLRNSHFFTIKGSIIAGCDCTCTVLVRVLHLDPED